MRKIGLLQECHWKTLGRPFRGSVPTAREDLVRGPNPININAIVMITLDARTD